MKMKGKFRSVWRVGIAVVLAASLGLVMAAPAVVASPWDGTFRLSDQNEGFGTACWDTTTPAPHAGTYSVELIHTTNAGSIYVEFVPDPGITLADLDDITAASEWSFWHNTPATPALSNWAQLELQFTMPCGYDPANDVGHVEVTLMPLQAFTGTAGWVKQTVVSLDTPAWCYYGSDPVDGTTFNNEPCSGAGVADLTGIEALINAEGAMGTESASAWELTRVRIELWEGVARTCHIDDVTIDGTLYAVERGPDEFYLDPDIAYNVKTAQETFTAMGPCGPLPNLGTAPTDGPYVVSWSVERGCGSGDVATHAGGTDATGGNAGNNFITVRMNTRGDAHICVTIDPDGTGDGTLPNIERCAEKKWGDIYCTELTKGDEVEDEWCVTESVTASFLWDDCTVEEQIAASGAEVDWWLMDIAALAAVQALEAALGNDPCDVDGGCGTYVVDFFSYDIDGSGVIEADEVFDSPRAALLAIYAFHELTDKVNNYLMPDVTSPADETHEQTISNANGETAVTVHTETQTGVMLATLTDYPIDKHGQNPVCVQHETWLPPPVEVQVKIPQVVWAGEKIALEKKWGVAFETNMVTFQLDQGSIGTLSEIDGTGDSGQVVTTAVDSDGIARCILESEYEGQAEVKCILYDDHYGTNVIGNHDFPVFFLKLESVEAIGTYPDIDINTDVDFGIQVKGWFITNCTELAVDPDTGEVRAEKGVDVDGDGYLDQFLPRGRWVLPDDWSRLAGIYETRRHWDLMDNNTDAINSTSALGPFNTDVVTTDPPGDAEKNVVGPFNTTQPVAIEDELVKWVATATVVGDATLLLPPALRCTVVPNGILEWQDCPMPAAYTEFTVIDTTLSEALKTGVVGYFTGSNLIWPFYSYEIPSSPFIPIGSAPEGYRHDSWGWGTALAEGPYPFWTDLGVSTVTTKLEVYTDNNGRAYVTMDALSIAGTADISAIVDYPYQRKHPAMKSLTTTQTWGDVTECVDSPAVEVGLENILADPLRRVVVYHEWGGVWTSFDSDFPAATTLTTLESGKGYWINVSTGCTLDYYDNDHVFTGDLWYMIGWVPCP